jgi:hypothetical protein
MPKPPARKRTTKAATKPAVAKPKKKSAAKMAERSVLNEADCRAIVHACIAGCAGHDDFSPNDPLANIPANAQCVQTCIIEKTGRQVLVSETDSENDIAGIC